MVWCEVSGEEGKKEGQLDWRERSRRGGEAEVIAVGVTRNKKTMVLR